MWCMFLKNRVFVKVKYETGSFLNRAEIVLHLRCRADCLIFHSPPREALKFAFLFMCKVGAFKFTLKWCNNMKIGRLKKVNAPIKEKP